eukprot:scaffold113813_cov63-Phaeocystis_antarctica.AAC.1
MLVEPDGVEREHERHAPTLDQPDVVGQRWRGAHRERVAHQHWGGEPAEVEAAPRCERRRAPPPELAEALLRGGSARSGAREASPAERDQCATRCGATAHVDVEQLVGVRHLPNKGGAHGLRWSGARRERLERRERKGSGRLAAHVSQLGGGVRLVERELLAVERECERQQRGQRRLDPPPRANVLRAAHRAVAVARGAQGASAADAAPGGGGGLDGLRLLCPAGAASRGGGHDVVREVAAARLRDARRPAAARRSDAVRRAHERRTAAARGAAVRGRRGSGHEGGVVADLGLAIAGGQGVGGRDRG